MDAQTQIEYGNLHPLDESAGESTDWAHSAARGVVASMQDVPELSAVLDTMDDTAKVDFVAALADVIRTAQAEDSASKDVAQPE
jgi:hypothetical protein